MAARKPSIGLKQSGFSLIEIILALGIISFALVGILGLFPVAVDAATSSQRETHAALIARSIFDQLNARPESPKRIIGLSEDFDGSSPAPVTLDLDKGSSATINYDIDGNPSAGGGTTAIYQAEISVAPVTGPPDLGVSQVTVTVKPRNASGVSYPFASLLLRK